MSLKNSSSYGFPEETPQPSRQNSSEAILMFLLAVGTLLIILQIPGVNEFLLKKSERAGRPAIDQSALVWANKDAGLYYCSGSKLYGSGVGAYMKQGDALTAGYQPVLGNYCNAERPANSQENASATP